MMRGEIWWVDLGVPFGSEPGFERPVVIIQDNSFNKSNISTVIVAALTTNLRLAEAPGNVLLKKSESHLTKDSVVNVSQIVTLDRERFLKKAGKLKPLQLRNIDNGIKLVLGIERA